MNLQAHGAQASSVRQLWLPLLVTLLVFSPALTDLVINWSVDDNYSHGFLVPLVSAWLVWSRREELRRLPAEIDLAGLALLGIGLLLFVLGNGASEYFSVRLAFVLTLSGLVWTLLGRAIARATWFAQFFLLFMIPLPYVLYYAATFPMQSLATTVTVTILDLIGMGVVRQGNIIHISGHSLEVAEACSGMRSIMSLLALGALFAYMTQKHFAAQAMLFLSTIPIAVFANVVRVFVTTVAVSADFTEVTQEPLHSVMGLLVFVVAFVLLFLFNLILKQLFK